MSWVCSIRTRFRQNLSLHGWVFHCLTIAKSSLRSSRITENAPESTTSGSFAGAVTIGVRNIEKSGFTKSG